jgi:DUF4097 and DUF4098 domain-containing protein YvlB
MARAYHAASRRPARRPAPTLQFRRGGGGPRPRRAGLPAGGTALAIPKAEMEAGQSAVRDPIEAAEWLEESLPVEPGGTLFVRTSRGKVDVRAHDANEVRVEAEARGRQADRVRFTLEQSGNDVRFEVHIDGWLIGLFGALDVRVRLWVPRRYGLALRASGGDVRVDGLTGDLGLKTSGGDLAVSRVVGQVELLASGGNLELEHVDGDVKLRTSGGNLALRDIFGDVDARSSGGELNIDGVDGTVRAKSSGGGVSIVFLGDPEGEIETSGGKVEVFVREDASFDFDAKSSGGNIHVELELARVQERGPHRSSGRVGAGGHKLRLRSSGGGIRIALL